jgi:Xaa-Pro aminopeptidase
MSATPSPYTLRRTRLQTSIPNGELWLISRPSDLYYFCQVPSLVPEENEGVWLAGHSTSLLLTNAFTPLPPAEDSLERQVGCEGQRLITHLNTLLGKTPFTTLRLDYQHMSTASYLLLSTWAGEHAVIIGKLDRACIWQLREQKDDTEIACLEKAVVWTKQCIAEVRTELKTGMTEIEVAASLEAKLRQLEYSRVAFPTIVAFGSHTALPHHQPSTQVLQDNQPILIDCGATCEGYRADLTRTWWHGEQPTQQFLDVETAVQTAYQAAIALLKPGVTAAEVDAAARTALKTAGWGEHFIHTTGHGVGLDIHEPPSLSSRTTSALREHMVVTIEPGVYLKENFGVRFENTLLLTTAGNREL